MSKTFAPKSPWGAPGNVDQDAGDRALEAIYRLPRGVFAPRFTLESTVAELGELIIVDTSAGNVIVTLRDPAVGTDGQSVAVCHLRGGNTCQVASVATNGINDGKTKVTIAAGGLERIHAWQGRQWLMSEGTPTAYIEDLRFPSSGINPPGTASDPTRDTVTGLLFFSPTQTNIVAGVAQMAHGRQADSDIYPHIHIHGSTTDPGVVNNQVVWRLQYNWVNLGGQWPPAGSWGTTDKKTFILPPNAGGQMVTSMASFDTIDGTGKTASSMFYYELVRLGADAADTYPDICYLDEYDIHFWAQAGA